MPCLEEKRIQGKKPTTTKKGKNDSNKMQKENTRETSDNQLKEKH